jgi:hypothetical protein
MAGETNQTGKMTDTTHSAASTSDGIIRHKVTVAEVRGFVEVIGLPPAITARCSALFMFEVYCRARVPTLPGDPAKIVAEVRGLEDLSRPAGTKAAEQFDRPPLRGFWKKHYLVGGISSFAKNIVLGFGKKKRGLRQIIQEHWNPATAHLPPEAVSRNIAKAITSSYADRSLSHELTGEWIIFARHEGQNYYLCLAMHDEVRVDPNVLVERIKNGCVSEFPFLQEQLEHAAQQQQ